MIDEHSMRQVAETCAVGPSPLPLGAPIMACHQMIDTGSGGYISTMENNSSSMAFDYGIMIPYLRQQFQLVGHLTC